MDSTTQDNFLLFGQFHPLDMNFQDDNNKNQSGNSEENETYKIRKCEEDIKDQDHPNKKSKFTQTEYNRLFTRRNAICHFGKTFDDPYPYFTSQYNPTNESQGRVSKTLADEEAEKEAIRKHFLQIQKEARIAFSFY